MKQLGVANPMAVPRITKITLNMGVGEALADKKVLDSAMGDIAKITRPEARARARRKKSVASFKVRDGVAIGCKVTLRSDAHVRVPRSPDQRRDAAHPRLPRRVAARVRRPRQLQPRRQRADHFSRDQLRPSRRHPRAWTSRSRRRRRTTTPAGRCSKRSSFRCRSDR